MRDPFQTLGLSRTASEPEVKSAYRRLAKQHHPDLFPGDDGAIVKFREICEAYDQALLLAKTNPAPKKKSSPFSFGGGAKRRRAGDRSQTQAQAQPRTQAKTQTKARDTSAPGGGSTGGIGAGDLFGEILHKFHNRPDGERAANDGYVRLDGSRLSLTFAQAAAGTSLKVILPSGQKVRIKVPGGVKSGQKLRIRPQAADGSDPAEAQEILFDIDVKAHPFFTLHGVNVYLELPVTVDEAVLGARVEVPTVEGPVMLKIPSGSNNDTVFRLRGKGAVVFDPARKGKPLRGDQYISLKVVLPDRSDKNFFRLVKKWAAKRSYEVRGHLTTPAFAK